MLKKNPLQEKQLLTSRRFSLVEDKNIRLYPNYDFSVWLRSCEVEITEPIYGKVYGKIPTWLNGSLLRNGPGGFKIGDIQYEHVFDSAALLHK